MEKQADEKAPAFCPVGRFFAELEKRVGRESEFCGHMTRSRIEFLKAIRSLVDEGIERMEKRNPGANRRATKIEVE